MVQVQAEQSFQLDLLHRCLWREPWAASHRMTVATLSHKESDHTPALMYVVDWAQDDKLGAGFKLSSGTHHATAFWP